MRLSSAFVLGSALVAMAHPGEHHEESASLVLARREHRAAAARGLEACKNKRSFRDLQARALQRRAATVGFHRKAKRVDASGTGHNLTDSRTDITADSDSSTVFGDSHTCILNPEGEVGPFYVPGELVRKDLREDQPGVDVVLDGQFIDVETCEPIQGLYWDVWNCNSTGVYSGVVSNGNGNSDDLTNLDATFLRGLQQSDSDGVVQFLTLFPGHYSGRTNHHHMVAWLNATVLPNNTLVAGVASHIGQIFWDQDLVYQVEATAPYSTNTIDLTLNADDHVVSDETENSDSDPFLNYVLLGDSIEDGLFGWVTIGINTSATYTPTYSFEYTSDGGVAASGGNGGGGGMGGGGQGGAPGGGGPGNGTMTTGPTSATSTSSSSSTATSSVTTSGAERTYAVRYSGLSIVVGLIAAGGLLVGRGWGRN